VFGAVGIDGSAWKLTPSQVEPLASPPCHTNVGADRLRRVLDDRVALGDEAGILQHIDLLARDTRIEVTASGLSDGCQSRLDAIAPQT